MTRAVKTVAEIYSFVPLGAEDLTFFAGKEVILDSNVVIAHSKDLSAILRPGERPVITKTILAEVRGVAARRGQDITRAGRGFRVVKDTTDVEDAIKIRNLVKGDRLKIKGLFGDGRIGDTAIKTGRTLITADKKLNEAVTKLGGKSRLVRGQR